MGSNPTLAAMETSASLGRPRRVSRVRKVSHPGGESFALTAAPPVRALAIASVVAMVGATLIVGSGALGLGPFVLAVGVAGLGLAVALSVAALTLVARLRCTLVLDPDGITVIRARRISRLAWSDIDRVSLAGPRLTLVTKASGGADVSVVNLRGQSDPTFTSLARAIRGRLDADRGYRTS